MINRARWKAAFGALSLSLWMRVHINLVVIIIDHYQRQTACTNDKAGSRLLSVCRHKFSHKAIMPCSQKAACAMCWMRNHTWREGAWCLYRVQAVFVYVLQMLLKVVACCVFVRCTGLVITLSHHKQSCLRERWTLPLITQFKPTCWLAPSYSMLSEKRNKGINK